MKKINIQQTKRHQSKTTQHKNHYKTQHNTKKQTTKKKAERIRRVCVLATRVKGAHPCGT